MKAILSLTILNIVFILTGCTHLNSEFDCPMAQPMGCKSLDEVNAVIDNQEAMATIPRHSLLSYQQKAVYPSSRDTPPINDITNGLKLWISPFKDEEGNYHSESNIYVPINAEEEKISVDLKGKNT